MIAAPAIRTEKSTQFLSRIAYCEICAQSQRPTRENTFILYGSTRRAFFIHKPEKDVASDRAGYTPHLFQLDQSANGQVVYLSICSCIGCGFQIQKEAGGKKSFKYVRPMQKGVMSVTDWNALVMLKDDGYRL